VLCLLDCEARALRLRSELSPDFCRLTGNLVSPRLTSPNVFASIQAYFDFLFKRFTSVSNPSFIFPPPFSKCLYPHKVLFAPYRFLPAINLASSSTANNSRPLATWLPLPFVQGDVKAPPPLVSLPICLGSAHFLFYKSQYDLSALPVSGMDILPNQGQITDVSRYTKSSGSVNAPSLLVKSSFFCS